MIEKDLARAELLVINSFFTFRIMILVSKPLYQKIITKNIQFSGFFEGICVKTNLFLIVFSFLLIQDFKISCFFNF